MRVKLVVTVAWLSHAAPALMHAQAAATPANLASRVTNGFANSNGVKIHFAAIGDGRGFPTPAEGRKPSLRF